jgi:hypothetical protein
MNTVTNFRMNASDAISVFHMKHCVPKNLKRAINV